MYIIQVSSWDFRCLARWLFPCIYDYVICIKLETGFRAACRQVFINWLKARIVGWGILILLFKREDFTWSNPMKIPWLTVTNAFFGSRNTAPTIFPLSKELFIFSMRWQFADSVECFGLKPNCCGWTSWVVSRWSTGCAATTFSSTFERTGRVELGQWLHISSWSPALKTGMITVFF